MPNDEKFNERGVDKWRQSFKGTGSRILWQQNVSLSSKKGEDEEVSQKWSKMAWRHLRTIPD